jgi:AraC-like DNA-binding protein
MTTEDSYVQFITQYATLPPLTPGETLHWNGLSPAVRVMDLMPASEPVARLAIPAQGNPVTGPSVTPPLRSCLALPPAPAIDWAMVAASMTFYLAPGLLKPTRNPVIPGATGALVWVRQEGHRAYLTPDIHPILLVQITSVPLQRGCVELVPHLPPDDPLCHHMGLVLWVAFTAEAMADRLYAESLTNALAVHFLHRYATYGHTAQEASDGLSPSKLRQTIASIQAHLEHTLSLAVLADVAQLSPNHFAHLFKLATGQTPHQYVLGCRMARAKQLLAETDIPLSTIGPQVGLTDQSYFTVLFRKHVAMTPKAYRDALQQA